MRVLQNPRIWSSTSSMVVESSWAALWSSPTMLTEGLQLFVSWAFPGVGLHFFCRDRMWLELANERQVEMTCATWCVGSVFYIQCEALQNSLSPLSWPLMPLRLWLLLQSVPWRKRAFLLPLPPTPDCCWLFQKNVTYSKCYRFWF